MQKLIFIRISDFLARQEIPIHHPSVKVLLKEAFFSSVINMVCYISGNEDATLFNKEKSVGSYQVEFNAAGLSSGIYFYELQAGSFIQTKKMLMIK